MIPHSLLFFILLTALLHSVSYGGENEDYVIGSIDMNMQKVRLTGGGVLSARAQDGKSYEYTVGFDALFGRDQFAARVRTEDTLEFFKIGGSHWDEYGVSPGKFAFFHQLGMGPPNLQHGARAAMPLSELYFVFGQDSRDRFKSQVLTDGTHCLESKDIGPSFEVLSRLFIREKCLAGFDELVRIGDVEYHTIRSRYEPPICRIPWEGAVETSVFPIPSTMKYEELRSYRFHVEVTLVDGFESVIQQTAAELRQGTVSVPAAHRYVNELGRVMSDLDWNEWYGQMKKQASREGSKAKPVESTRKKLPADHLPARSDRWLIMAGAGILLLAGLMLLWGRK